MQLGELIECALGGDPLLLYKILHLLFFPLVWILWVLYLESQKNYQHGLEVGCLEFQFLQLRGYLTNPFRSLSLCFGVIGKTLGLISCNNFVKKCLSALAIMIMSWQDVTWSSLCSGVKECGTKHRHNYLLPKSSFRIWRTTVLGMFRYSWCNLMVIFDQISNSSNGYLSLSQFWMATSLFSF